MNVTIRGHTEVRAQLQEIGRQAKFALALALNGTANQVQRAVRTGLDERFTVRRKAFIENTVFRDRRTDFATKQHPVAIVRVHPDRDVLAKHEDGGAKRPVSGRSIAIPLGAVRRNRADIITSASRPRALQAKKNVFREKDVLYKRTGTGKRQKVQALYLFRRSVALRPRLGMADTAAKVIPRAWPSEAERAINRALSTAR